MNFILSQRAKVITYIFMGIGLISVILGFITDDSAHHGRFWSNILINGFYFMAISLGALFFYALNFATETAWTVVIRRVMEAIYSFIPYAAVIILIVLLASTFHLNHIYHWMDPEVLDPASDNFDPLIAHKSLYLNKPFFWIRTLLYLGTFIWFGRWFRKRSLEEDELGGTGVHFKGYKRSAIYLGIFALFSTTLAWDWIMSIDVHWFSSLFGWYVFSGMWVSGMNVIAILTLYLISKGYLPEINNSHLQDLGKWIFALSFLWSYLWFAQYVLIWYGDMPEEVTYYMMRIGSYRLPFFGMFLINFAVPMISLMSRDAKRNPRFLIVVGTIIFIGHYLDTYLLFTPGILFDVWTFGWFEVGVLIGFTGLFINVVLRTLTQAALVPKHSPYLSESLHHSV